MNPDKRLPIDGPKGTTRDYLRGHEFAFEFSDGDRDAVKQLMELHGMPFEVAFDTVKRSKR